MIEDYITEEHLIVLVGNKSDLTENRIVTSRQCRELAQSLGFRYFESSAKDDINVKQTFDYIVDAILEKRKLDITLRTSTAIPDTSTCTTTSELTPRTCSKCAC